MSVLSARQRRHVVKTLRRELEMYGGIPSLHKRHKLRVADRLAELYGLPRKEVLGIWDTWVADRRLASEEYQRKRFLERVAAGTASTCHADGGYVYIPTIRPPRR